jgi:hypothetical protein
MSFDAARADKAALKNVATFLLGVIPTFQRRRQEDPGYAASSSQWYFTTVPEIPERLLRCRRVAVEPKVPLANERTLLAWLEWATFLAGASVAFATYSDFRNDPLAQIIGLLTLPFSISVIIYALYECELPIYIYIYIRNRCMSLLVDGIAYASPYISCLLKMFFFSLIHLTDTVRSKFVQRGDPANKFADKKGIVILSSIFICFLLAIFLAKLK